MTEPRRLIETCDIALERAILNAGISVQASSLARERTLLALFGPSSKKSNVLSFVLRRKGRLLLAALSMSTLAAAMPFGYFVWQSRAENAADLAKNGDIPPSFETVKATLPTKVSQPESTPQTDEVQAPSVELELVPATVETTKRRASANASPSEGTSSGAVGKASEPNLLAAETSALDAVRSRLHSGDPRGALQLLDAYQRDFPRPRLALEAEVLRIFAYDKAGQPQIAKKRAQTFVSKYPKGVLSARVRRYLEQ
jgi:hypothetical protein